MRFVYLFLIILSQLSPAYAAARSVSTADIEVCFTPGQDCTAQITHALDQAKHSILVQAYSFTSEPIAKHLIAAKKRGVDIKVLLDKSQKSEKYSAVRFLLNQKIPVWIDYKPAIAHNKIMIIDGQKIITGSFNFTKAAQYRNAENLLVINDAELAKQYIENWRHRYAVSEPANDAMLKNKESSSHHKSASQYSFSDIKKTILAKF